ncbi:MAG: hypothetical protein QNJ38_24670 [Prochloraceae cyanobacterium]|nr:hypothetical protein [Prochloraceae cyanobacterium]
MSNFNVRRLKELNAVSEQLHRAADLYGAGRFDTVIDAEIDPVLTANKS